MSDSGRQIQHPASDANIYRATWSHPARRIASWLFCSEKPPDHFYGQVDGNRKEGMHLQGLLGMMAAQLLHASSSA